MPIKKVFFFYTKKISQSLVARHPFCCCTEISAGELNREHLPYQHFRAATLYKGTPQHFRKKTPLVVCRGPNGQSLSHSHYKYLLSIYGAQVLCWVLAKCQGFPHPTPGLLSLNPTRQTKGRVNRAWRSCRLGHMEREKTWTRPEEVTLERQLNLNLTLHPGRVFTGSQGLETGLNIPAACSASESPDREFLLWLIPPPTPPLPPPRPGEGVRHIPSARRAKVKPDTLSAVSQMQAGTF